MLLRNSGWNLVGQLLPFIAALVSIPVLLHQLGVDRLGLLLLAWLVAGSSSFFDLGLGRATTKLVAEVPDRDAEHLVVAVWASLVLMIGLGAVASVVLVFLAPDAATGGWLSISGSLRNEAVAGVRVLAIAIPLVTASACLRGVLEARQRFDLVNYVRAPAGVLTYVGPMCAAMVSPTLPAAMVGLVAARAVTVVAYAFASRAVMPTWRSQGVDVKSMLQVARYGAWLTVSGLAGPVVAQLDKFVIGGLVSVAAVTYYVTPYEVATKVWALPGALAAVLFAAFSAIRIPQERRAAQSLFERGLRYLSLPLVVITAGIVAMGPWAIGVWLGPAFAVRSGFVLQVLAIGVFANSMAYLPAVFVQASGRPDLTAKLYFLELLPYLGLLWAALHFAGIQGAAIAWSLRCFADAFVLFWLAGVRLGWTKAKTRRFIALALIATFFLLSVLLLHPHVVGVTYAALVISGTIVVSFSILRQASPNGANPDGMPSTETFTSSSACPLCGSIGRRSLEDLRDNVYAVPGSWCLMTCPSAPCGLSWLSPMPALEARADFYRNYYTHADEGNRDRVARPHMITRLEELALRKLGYAAEDGNRLGWLSVVSAFHPGGRAELTASVLYLRAPRAGNRVLDVGCGNGDLMARLNALGWSAVGVDTDPAAVEHARDRGLDVRLGAVADQSYPSDHFDAVISAHVIEHIDDPRQLLQDCARVLKPGGTMVFVTPNGKSLCRRLFGRAWSSLDPPRHLMLHTPESLRSAAKSADLDIVSCGSTVRYARSVAGLSCHLLLEGGIRGGQSVGWLLQACAAPLQLFERILISLGMDGGEELRLVATKK